MDEDLHGREAVRNAFGGLTDTTILHVLANTIVDVIDEDHVDATSCVMIYVENGFLDDGPIPFGGPNRLGANIDKMVRTNEGWRNDCRGGQRAFARD